MKKWVFLIPLLTACQTSLDEYQGTAPTFDLKQYFNGDIVAWGIIQDYSKKMTRHFCVDIQGQWQDNRGTLDEVFYFNDGEIGRRVWQLSIDEQGKVTGSAGDVIGTAHGGENGAAFNWHYVLRVPIDDTEYDFTIDDWMYRLDEHRVMNRSYMKKLGITLAEISIFFDKSPGHAKCKPNAGR